jgi:hypothetical protein
MTACSVQRAACSVQRAACSVQRAASPNIIPQRVGDVLLTISA